MDAKEENNRFEVYFGLTCLGGIDSQSQTLLNSEQSKIINDNNNPDSPLYLQSSHLEESNFKDQFFVTRSSFEVN